MHPHGPNVNPDEQCPDWEYETYQGMPNVVDQVYISPTETVEVRAWGSPTPIDSPQDTEQDQLFLSDEITKQLVEHAEKLEVMRKKWVWLDWATRFMLIISFLAYSWASAEAHRQCHH